MNTQTRPTPRRRSRPPRASAPSRARTRPPPPRTRAMNTSGPHAPSDSTQAANRGSAPRAASRLPPARQRQRARPQRGIHDAPVAPLRHVCRGGFADRGTSLAFSNGLHSRLPARETKSRGAAYYPATGERGYKGRVPRLPEPRRLPPRRPDRPPRSVPGPLTAIAIAIRAGSRSDGAHPGPRPHDGAHALPGHAPPRPDRRSTGAPASSAASTTPTPGTRT